MPPDFEEVKLTQEQIDNLVYEERSRIYFEAKAIQAKNISANERAEAKRLYNAEETARFVQFQFPKLNIDESNRNVFDMLCLYLSRDKKFEEYGENYSLYKGIALAGNPGVGKTVMMKVFQLNKRQCYHVIDMNKVQEDCKDEFDYYKTFTSNIPGWGGIKKYFYQDHVLWCIDDVGKEELLNSYGNKSYIFSKIIEYRSSNRQLLQYYPLHITTMLTAKDFGDKYGDFVRSRMREQFNWIELKGTDKRK